MQLPLDTKLLKTFITIVEMQSYTRAGERLGLTQPAISMQMKRLEDSLGKALFDRTRQGIRLTREGEVLLDYGRRLLALSEEAKAHVARPDQENVIRLGTSDDYANILLPDVFRRFAAAHPDVRIDLACANGSTIERRLDEGAIDLALIARLGEEGGSEVIRTDDLVWIGADEAPNSARPVALAAFPEGCVCRAAMTAALDRSGRKWRVAFSSDNIEAIHRAIRSGIAISAVERSLVPAGVQILKPGSGLPVLERVSLVLRQNPECRSLALAALAREIRLSLAVDMPSAPSRLSIEAVDRMAVEATAGA